MSQCFYQKASVQAAIVVTLGTIITTCVVILHQQSTLTRENARLSQDCASKDRELLRLETELAPFRALALERFPGKESQALSNLAERLRDLTKQTQDDRQTLKSVATQASYAKLREASEIRPDGTRVHFLSANDNSGMAETTKSQIQDTLQCALAFANGGNTNECMTCLMAITNKVPEWPYGHFYIGMITREQIQFRIVVELCQNMREAGIKEVGTYIIEAVSETYLGDYDAARASLRSGKKMQENAPPVAMFNFPKSAPPDLCEEFTKIARVWFPRQ
jgi:hypothetical protein